MEKREYSLSDGYLYFVEGHGCYAVIYNNTGSKCFCLTTNCEFDFKGNDAPENKLICHINHKTLIETMNRHYGLEGSKPVLMHFKTILSAFAPELSKKQYMGKEFTKKELEGLDSFISTKFKKFIDGSQKMDYEKELGR